MTFDKTKVLYSPPPSLRLTWIYERMNNYFRDPERRHRKNVFEKMVFVK